MATRFVMLRIIFAAIFVMLIGLVVLQSCQTVELPEEPQYLFDANDSDPYLLKLEYKERPSIGMAVEMSRSMQGDELLWFLREQLAWIKLPAFFELPCGHKEYWERLSDIPLVDTPCPCGDPNHWIVKYEVSINPKP